MTPLHQLLLVVFGMGVAPCLLHALLAAADAHVARRQRPDVVERIGRRS